MSDKIQDKKDQTADKPKSSELKDEDLKNVVGGGPAGSTPTPGPGRHLGPDIPSD